MQCKFTNFELIVSLSRQLSKLGTPSKSYRGAYSNRLGSFAIYCRVKTADSISGLKESAQYLKFFLGQQKDTQKLLSNFSN
jgi:hypothetical protein